METAFADGGLRDDKVVGHPYRADSIPLISKNKAFA